MAKNAVCSWDFTISKDKCDLENLLRDCRRDCKKWVFQEEEGKGGYRHFQGGVSLKVKNRKGPNWGYGEHWSITSEENADNDFYVTKEDTRISGPWSDKDMYIPKQVRNISLYPCLWKYETRGRQT